MRNLSFVIEMLTMPGDMNKTGDRPVTIIEQWVPREINIFANNVEIRIPAIIRYIWRQALAVDVPPLAMELVLVQGCASLRSS